LLAVSREAKRGFVHKAGEHCVGRRRDPETKNKQLELGIRQLDLVCVARSQLNDSKDREAPCSYSIFTRHVMWVADWTCRS
jgi:hypothetical protein